MPELPEVEIVRQSLNRKIKAKKIKKTIIKNRNLRFKIPLNFENFLRSQTIKKVDRFSKYIILCFENFSFCLIHLGMSGTIHIIENNKKSDFTNTSFYNSKDLPRKHNHVVIYFNSLKMIYNDPRRFGFFRSIKNKRDLDKQFNHLGPEPFFTSFDSEYVYNYFKNKKKDIKSFLLDQKFVSGIGNIYASEILFLCKIKPSKKAKNLKKNECKKIVYYSKLVLKRAIRKGGSSIKDFKNTLGTKGSFQKEFNVYQRANLNCLKYDCNGIIKKKITSNRSTFFCNICQK